MSWWLWPDEDPKYIKKRDAGVVFYTKPKVEHKRSFKKTFLNRVLQTKRIRTHTKK